MIPPEHACGETRCESRKQRRFRICRRLARSRLRPGLGTRQNQEDLRISQDAYQATQRELFAAQTHHRGHQRRSGADVETHACGEWAPTAAVTRPIAVAQRVVHVPYRPVRSRCQQPGQQQGRRCPCCSSCWHRSIRRCRVRSCLVSSTQQMNSLRANDVLSFQAASATVLSSSATHRSAGSSCTTPPGTSGALMESR